MAPTIRIRRNSSATNANASNGAGNGNGQGHGSTLAPTPSPQRRNVGEEEGAYSHSHDDTHAHTHAHAPASQGARRYDLDDFELQVVDRAVSDQRADQQRQQQRQQSSHDYGEVKGERCAHPARPPMQRHRTSLLEQIAAQDREEAAAAAQQQQRHISTSHQQWQPAAAPTPTPPSRPSMRPSSAPLSRSAARLDTGAAPSAGLQGLHVLDEAHEHESESALGSPSSTVSTNNRHGRRSSGSSIFAPLGDRPEMVRAGPSKDRIKDLAPGPRMSRANNNNNNNNKDLPQPPPPVLASSTPAARFSSAPERGSGGGGIGSGSGGASWSRTSADSSTRNLLPPTQHTPTEGGADAEKRGGGDGDKDDANAGGGGAGGLFAALMRRGRSYTLPSRKTPTPETSAAAAPQPQRQRGESPQSQTEHTQQNDDTSNTAAAAAAAADTDPDADLHEDGVVDYLDVVDAEVGALNYMSNISNSIFIPNLSSLYERRITHDLPAVPAAGRRASVLRKHRGSHDSASVAGHSTASALEEGRARATPSPAADRRRPSVYSTAPGVAEKPGLLRRATSALSSATAKAQRRDADAEGHIPVWAEMDEEERHELDAHVQHLLTRPERFRRGLRGFGIWARTPMGFIMLCYGLAITGWGIVIMLFIWKWIDLHDHARQRYWIEICDQVLCALFAAVGLGFAPFRAVDTWRMAHIAHYHRLSWKRRKEFNLPELGDPNDLPRPKGYNEAFPLPEVEQERIQDMNRHRALGLIPEAEESSSHHASSRNTSVHQHRRHHHGHSAQSSTAAVGAGAGAGARSPEESSSSASSFASAPATPARVNTLTSPLTSSSSSTSAGPPAPLAQTMSNEGAVKTHRWWHIRSKQEKRDEKSAAEAALRAVEEAAAPSGRRSGQSSTTSGADSSASSTAEADAHPPGDVSPKSKPRAGVPRIVTDNDTDGDDDGDDDNAGSASTAPATATAPPPTLRAAPPLGRNASILSEITKPREDVVVLTPSEQSQLEHHQRRFHKSHTFYRYHETTTHAAFPLNLMITIVVLLDCHSLLQGSLGGVTWGIRYQHRPTALTACLITCSLSCNAVAGFLIYWGGRKTKKTEEVKRRLRIALEEEAYRRMREREKAEGGAEAGAEARRGGGGGSPGAPVAEAQGEAPHRHQGRFQFHRSHAPDDGTLRVPDSAR